MITKELYQTIIKELPILCIDLIVKCKRGKKILLVKRNNEPLLGEFWVPGGRLLIGESVVDGLHRKLLEETGIATASDFNYVGFYEGHFECSAFGRHIYHTVSLVFDCEIDTSEKIILDSQSSQFVWSDMLPKDFIIKRRV